MIKMHVVDCSLLQAHASCPSLVERWLDFFDYFLPLYGTESPMNLSWNSRIVAHSNNLVDFNLIHFQKSNLLSKSKYPDVRFIKGTRQAANATLSHTKARIRLCDVNVDANRRHSHC